MANASLKAVSALHSQFGRWRKGAHSAALAFCLLALLFSDGCATRQRARSWFSEGKINRQWIEDVLRQSPFPPNQNIHAANLDASASLSRYIVQVRFVERPHVHGYHNLTVYVCCRREAPRLGAGGIRLREGDVVSIPRGIPHAFQSHVSTPAVAVVMVTPTFDGRDAIPVKENV